MKKLILSLVSVSLTLISCQNDISEDTSSIQNLNSDKKFQNLVNNSLSFNYKVINSKNKNIAMLIENNNYEQLSKNLNYKSSSNLTTDLNSQLELINYIITNYDVKEYNEQQLKELIIYEINEIDNLNSNISKADPNTCKRKFRNDMIIITAGAVAGHIACGTVDLTIVLGGLCHAGVIAAQAAASDNAALEYQNCR